jgi:uncharacterized membrane protein YbhN (UPF0104 family)
MSPTGGVTVPKGKLGTRILLPGLAVIALIAIWIAAKNESTEILRVVVTAPRSIWLVVALTSVSSYLLRFARWELVLRSLGHHLPRKIHLRIYMSAFALTVTPGKAGELSRSVHLQRHGVPWPDSVGAFIAERLMDVAAVLLIAVLGTSMFAVRWQWMVGAGLSLGAALWLLRSRPAIAALRALSWRNAHGQALIKAGREIWLGGTLLRLSGLSLAAWAIQSWSLWWIVRELGYPLQLSELMGIYALGILAGALSFIPAGLGTTEAVIVLLLSAKQGLPLPAAVAAAMLCRGLTLWLAVGIGLMASASLAWMPRRDLTDADAL